MRPSLALQNNDELQIVTHVPARFVAGTMRNLVLFYWLADGTSEGVQTLDRLIDVQTAGHTRMASALHIIHGRVGLPDAEVRSGLHATMRRSADYFSCIGVVMLGAGFWASAIQSALTGIRMLTPTGNALMRFGATPASLADWFVAQHAERTGERLSEQQLLAAAEKLRDVGDAAYPG